MSVKRTIDYWVLKKRACIVRIITFETKYSINFAQNITIISSHLSNCRVGSAVYLQKMITLLYYCYEYSTETADWRTEF